jgi:aldehyde dehydrogenase (NAD+)
MSNDTNVIDSTLNALKQFFASGATRPVAFRKQQLDALKNALDRYEPRLLSALKTDLGKSAQEAYLTEISLLRSEIRYHRRNLARWSRPRRVPTPMHLWPGRSRILPEPLGTALIIAPWNYPVMLTLSPLIGAISAGCTALLKPSEFTPTVSGVLDEMIRETFEPGYISLVQGDHTVGAALLERRFDVLFFTGNTAVGRLVMKAAAEHLTPVILELGGKSPCIVDRDADLAVAARRISWGKSINSGQTCIAPDYLLVHASVKSTLTDLLKMEFADQYGQSPARSELYAAIVNQRAFDRLQGYTQKGKVVWGGEADPGRLRLAPTILDEVSDDDPVMQSEIFGPILPVIPFQTLDEAIEKVNDGEKPLALYYFGGSRGAETVLARTSSGGACINDTIMHIANHYLPFGGVGNSGMGKYHGYESFRAFSHERSVVYTPTWIDLPFRYAPFRYFSLIKKLL